jgi:predicted Rossmann fold flavoprotein
MSEIINNYDVIILGAGAAGLMCAIEAGYADKRVLLIEHNDTVGKKIRISGGGRCNFTNINTEPSRYVSQNPRFCYSALSRYTPEDFIAYVERHGIDYHEKKLGQLFCDGSAQQIIDALLQDCEYAGVELRVSCTVSSVEKEEDFTVNTNQGVFYGKALVVATGGLSIPKMGATSFGYTLAEQFGIPVLPCTPGLVPMALNEKDLMRLDDLSGIAFDAAVSIGKTRFEEAVLITHRGLSGPAILQISSFWNQGDDISINLFPDINVEDELMELKYSAPKTMPKEFMLQRVSARLAQRLCDLYDWEDPLGEISDKFLRNMAKSLQDWRIHIPGTEGYPKAEVTCGGVDTRALSPKTMECKDLLGLYFIGEVMDVTGWLGGYNFQWAWASAVAAGRAV